MLPFIFTEHALNDTVYHAMKCEQKQVGLGARFMNEVDNTVIEISKMPKAFINAYKTTRERKTKHFPYKLIYTIEDGVIYVHAVYPCKANPVNKYKYI